jgi:ubiquinone/menaquinone biosynthesis C-methylase UbiE
MTATRVTLDLRDKINSGEAIKLDLGCGSVKQSGHIGIDTKNFAGVDIVADIEKGLPFVPNDCVDAIYSSHFFEHVENLEGLMAECFRVLRREGRMEVRVPHFSNPYFYSDYTHRRFFGLYTFHYFAATENQLERKVPNFYTEVRFRVLTQRLIFSSPFPSRNRWKQRLGRIFNRNAYWQELYEENFCYLFPCYELHVTLAPDK